MITINIYIYTYIHNIYIYIQLLYYIYIASILHPLYNINTTFNMEAYPEVFKNFSPLKNNHPHPHNEIKNTINVMDGTAGNLEEKPSMLGLKI